MSRRIKPLDFLLATSSPAKFNLDEWNFDGLKTAARFWFGTTVGNKLRKVEAAQELERVLSDPEKLRAGLDRLSENERQLLAVCKRYGGTISGELMKAEGLARGLLEQANRDKLPHELPRRDAVQELQARMFFLSLTGRLDRLYQYSFSSRLVYPELTMPAALRELIEPAAPLGWPETGKVTPPAEGRFRRPPAAIALDLWTVASALHQASPVKINRGGSLAKIGQNRLRKLFPTDDSNPLRPPGFESLYYELLRGIGVVLLGTDERTST